MRSLTKHLLILSVFFMLATPFRLSSQTLKAVNDTIDLYPGIARTYNLLGNDTVPVSDSIRILGGTPTGSSLILVTGSYRGFFTFLVRPIWGFNGPVTANYVILDVTLGRTSTASILFRIHDRSYDTLEINNVRAAITAFGNEFFLPAAGSIGTYEGNLFRVPKQGGAGTVFNFVPWIGGKGSDSTLYLAAERFIQGPTGGTPGFCPDYYAGPVMDSVNYSVYQDTVWNHVWKVKKSEIEYHIAHWNDAGYKAPENILTWPGNGNTAYGQTEQLAPFHDRNGDGKYRASDGDYPLIRGDEAIFAVFNDDRSIHKETTGKKLKAEFRMMAYAFDLPGDSAFKNTIFLHYDIVNRSSRTYYNTFLGFFTDLDIGVGQDDYIGCDVERSSIVGFNGKTIDGPNQSYAYGAHPPAEAVTLLGGPFMDPAGHDRPRLDNTGHQLCNESVNGTGFGDSIADNERYGLTGFLPSVNMGQGFFSDPTLAPDYYRSMNSVWHDSVHLYYGGQGHPAYNGYGPDCRFAYPWESDSVNWGTGCRLPDGPLNWTMRGSGFTPGDIRGCGSSGPFTFRPGDIQQMDIAFVFARDYTGPDTLEPSVGKLREMVDIIRNSYNSGTLPGGNSFFGINEQQQNSSISLKIYPNPASDKINIQFEKTVSENLGIRIVNTTGTEVYSGVINPSGKLIRLDVRSLLTGIYFVTIQGKEFSSSGKVVIIK